MAIDITNMAGNINAQEFQEDRIVSCNNLDSLVAIDIILMAININAQEFQVTELYIL